MSSTARSKRAPRDRRAQADAPACSESAAPAAIVNLRDLRGDTSAAALLQRGIVRVDRETDYGNPYPIGRRYGSRADVIERYRRDLWRRIRSGDMPLEKLAALAHRPLACWCHPKPCHAEVLARAAVWATARLRETDVGGSPGSGS